MAHGDAPYQNDPTKSASYYVTLRDEAGRERTHWGVGLAEAMKNAQTAPVVGDQVGIQRVGVTPVIVPLAKVDAHGAVVTEQINAKRNQWVVEKSDYFKSGTASLSEAQARPTSPTAEKPLATTTAEVDSKTVMPKGMTRDQEVAAAIRSATTTREELQLKCFASQFRRRFEPVDLRFLAPRVALRHEYLRAFQTQFALPHRHITAYRRLGDLNPGKLLAQPRPDAMRCMPLLSRRR